MATYISLLRFTEQGVRHFQQSPDRATAFQQTAQKSGAKVIGQYWTLGEFDAVLLLEAASDEAATSLMLALAAAGNVRTTTLRAFTASEFGSIVAKAPKV